MAELQCRCQFGERRNKAGKVIKPASCHNRASGIFKVTVRAGRGTATKILFLCAECSFYRLPKRVRMIPAPEDQPSGKPVFFKDVVGIELLATLGSNFNVGDFIPLKGSKDWVEGKQTPKVRGPQKVRIKRIKSTEPKMDLAAYRKSLATHDDGK
jgi:hypothetical protein